MKKTLIAVWVIVLLVLTNLITLYFLTRESPHLAKTEFLQESLKGNYFYTIGPITDPAALANVNGYRKNVYLNSNGVLYDASEIQNYLTNILPGIMTRMSTGANITNYKWKIGFYWMLKPGTMGSGNRLAYCIVPTLVNKSDTTQVVDYFNDIGHIYAHPGTPSAGQAGSSCDTCNAYDEGQLWP